MKNFFKSKLATAIVLITTVVLAGIAIFTAMKLYQLRSTSVAPNAPSSIPHAQEASPSPSPKSCQLLTFTLATPTPTPTVPPGSTPTPTPTATATPGPTATPTYAPGAPNGCNGTCGSNENCQGGYYCNTTVGLCRNPGCPNSANCSCSGATATPTSRPIGGPAATATPEAALPVAGTNWPSILGISFGSIVLIGAFLLVL